MGYLLWSALVVAGLIGATLTREIGAEYIANFVAENDAASLGASTRQIANGPAIPADSPPGPSANADPVRRILVAGSAAQEAGPPPGTTALAQGSVVPAAAPAPPVPVLASTSSAPPV